VGGGGDLAAPKDSSAFDANQDLQGEMRHTLLYYRDLAADAVVSAVGRLWSGA
jgi:hypothetical protein